MPTINVNIQNKFATTVGSPVVVCGNSDYEIVFDFDAEWGAYPTKTARFVWNNQHTDVVFTGSVCPAPVIENAHFFTVGVFAGNLRTTAPARITTQKSILCGSGSPAAPTDDVYNQIMALLNKGGAVNGVPAGGKAGQLLYKKSDDDFDVEWSDLVIPKEYGLVTYNQDKAITVS